MASDSTSIPLHWQFAPSYTQLAEDFFSYTEPDTVPAPRMAVFNHTLASELGFMVQKTDWPLLAQYLSGNRLFPGSVPLALAYAGHQFGHFTMLGDGRALLLGEHVGADGQRLDVQLKGSGQTPYSRRGDGKATLSAMLREYLISEAIHHLGIPTSRSLAVVYTGQKVYRETPQDGAVLTRLAASHIRVGSFEYASRFLSIEALQQYTDYTIARHYPELQEAENKALALLEAVMMRQINLVVDWMRVGFIHGVMNTDNMSIAGETIDYGPCAFLNAYDPQKVFSSIDQQARYAFGKQPVITQWNLACLAGALLPLIDPDENAAVALARSVLDRFPEQYRHKWLTMMRQKLGFTDTDAGDTSLVNDLLQWMQEQKADYTQTFLALNDNIPVDICKDATFAAWHDRWQTRITAQPGGRAAAALLMQKANPVYIPRNHRVEAALLAATDDGDFAPFYHLLEVYASPYDYRDTWTADMTPPPGGDGDYCTFCGT
jgi:serine/tyrosine/threonine adenylyltransferase